MRRSRRMLGLPVMLVIDARGMTRGIAPLILGYQAFDRDIRIAGVILNNLGGSRHEAKLRAVIEHYTDVPVLGAVQHDPRLAIVERHLGLMPSNESDDAARRVADIGAAIGAAGRPRCACCESPRALRRCRRDRARLRRSPARRPDSDIRIGIAQDRAFGFYYADDFDALRAAGATLVRFDTLNDAHLPSVDALFIGGGFPELYARELEANAALRAGIRERDRRWTAGLRRVRRAHVSRAHAFAAVAGPSGWSARFAGDVVMRERPVGRGYVQLQETAAFPWPAVPERESRALRAHEFHYAALENLAPGLRYAYDVEARPRHRRRARRDRRPAMCSRRSRTCARRRRNDWAARFVEFIRRSGYRERRERNIVCLDATRGREALIV